MFNNFSDRYILPFASASKFVPVSSCRCCGRASSWSRRAARRWGTAPCGSTSRAPFFSNLWVGLSRTTMEHVVQHRSHAGLSSYFMFMSQLGHELNFISVACVCLCACKRKNFTEISRKKRNSFASSNMVVSSGNSEAAKKLNCLLPVSKAQISVYFFGGIFDINWALLWL